VLKSGPSYFFIDGLFENGTFMKSIFININLIKKRGSCV